MLIGTKQIETLYSISQMKIVKEIITVGDIEIEKHKFHYSKYVINIHNAGVRRLVLVKRVFNNLFVANTILVIKMVKKLNHYVCSQK